MATNSEKIDELIRVTSLLVVRADAMDDALGKEVERLSKQIDKLIAEQVEALRHFNEDARIRIAVLEREIETIKKSREEWGRRGWQLLVPVVTALVGGVVGYFLKR